jgi:signal-transduction protein with cAMP-binding, CBS, and nucleotidyltransferase domain
VYTLPEDETMALAKLAYTNPPIARETTVQEAVRIMTESSVGALAITEGRKVIGVFTERDLMKRIVFKGKDPARTTVGEAMTSPVETITHTTTLAQAAAIMREKHIRHVALVDEQGDLVGLVGLRYLLYQLMDELELKVDDLRNYLMTDGPGG